MSKLFSIASVQGGIGSQRGFATELWTLPRVGRVIQQQFRRRYSNSQVWRILRDLGHDAVPMAPPGLVASELEQLPPPLDFYRPVTDRRSSAGRATTDGA